MEIQSNKEYHRKALALLVCFFVAFMYAETILKPYMQKNNPQPIIGSSQTTSDQTSSQQTSTPAVISQGSETTSTQNTEVSTQAAVVEQTGIPGDRAVNEAGIISITTQNFEVLLSLLGGRITELHLRKQKASLEEGAPGLNLVHHSENAPYPLGVYIGETNDAWVKYSITSGGMSQGTGNQSLEILPGSGAKTLVLEGVFPSGKTIRKTLTFQPNGYLIDIAVQVPDAEGLVSLEWNRFLSDDDSSMLDPYNTQGFVWFDEQKARRTSVSDFEADEELGNIRWVSLADKYFTATLLAKDELLSGKALKTGNIYRSRLSGSGSKISVSLFAGPKSYGLLKELGHRLELNIDFGKLALISAPLLGLLVFLYGIFGNYGLAIVTLTIGVRLLLYPLNSASFKQMKKMQDLKPEMDRIREQYPDRQEQQQQLMAMYKKHGVNPVGGCLPMILQMPIFFGLYSALMLAVELRQAPFAFWITDLSEPEKLMIGGIGIPIMVILFVISMVVQQATTPSQMDPMQKKMMMGMPVVMGFMFMNFPSGLTLYWLTSNLISIGQQKGLLWAHDGGKSALKITLSVSVAVFVMAFVVTRF